MRITPGGSAKNACVLVRVHAADCEDTGIGLVLRRHPLTLVIPSHVSVLIEQAEAEYVEVDGVRHPVPAILPAPSLEKDDLVALRFSSDSRHVIRLGEVELTRSRVAVSSGDPIELIAKSASGVKRLQGIVEEIRGADGQLSLLTNIPVEPGMSGAPLLRDGRLAAVCQGRISHGDSQGNAVAIPVTDDGLADLQRIRAQGSVRRGLLAFVSILVVLVAVAGLAWSRFQIGGTEISEDKRMLTVHNGAAFTLRPSWQRSFDSKVHTHVAFASTEGGRIDRVAVGTWYEEGAPGSVYVFNTTGRLLWEYAVPDGDCIYPPTERNIEHVGFQVTHIVPADLDLDRKAEVLVSFVHNTWYPCKLMAFSPDGAPLAEYWHPGYIRTLVVGQGGTESPPLVVASASNNRLPRGWPYPQSLFAFRGLEISGQAPPYTGDAPKGSELWYRFFENIDSTVSRPKCMVIDLVDTNLDSEAEIRARLTDGRIYNLDESGRTTDTSLADAFVLTYGNLLPPVLHVVPLVEPDQLDVYHRFASQVPGEYDRILLGMGNLLTLLDRQANPLWTFTPPDDALPSDGAAAGSALYDLTLATAADLDSDGQTDILAAYNELTTDRCRLLVLDQDGQIRSEYWHAGPIQQLIRVRLGGPASDYVVGTALHPRLTETDEATQTVFAFHGLLPAGISPSYRETTQTGSHVWYQAIDPLPEPLRLDPIAPQLDAVDCDGDGQDELEIWLHDGRTYYVNGFGETVLVTADPGLTEHLDPSDIPPLRRLGGSSATD